MLNLVWGIAIIISAFSGGVQSILNNEGLIETIILSVYTKWILLSDMIWACIFAIFVLSRKKYKTESNLHYLTHKPLESISICVVIPAWNEEKSIEKVITDFQTQKFVKQILVIDNNSSDDTVEIAQKAGAKVIKKNENKGYSHSVLLGLREALKTNSNVILFTEADSTYNGYDVEKMLSYLPNVDMVLGSRYTQVLSEKDNQNSLMHIWGNVLLAKMIQIKYFSLLHMGVVELTDVGCTYRAVRRNALEKIINGFENPKTGKIKVSQDSGLFAIFMTLLGIEKNLKLVEIPVIFKKRIGISKTQAEKKTKGIKYGLRFFWHIIIH